MLNCLNCLLAKAYLMDKRFADWYATSYSAANGVWMWLLMLWKAQVLVATLAKSM